MNDGVGQGCTGGRVIGGMACIDWNAIMPSWSSLVESPDVIDTRVHKRPQEQARTCSKQAFIMYYLFLCCIICYFLDTI